MKKYKNLGLSMGGFRCVSLGINSDDNCLSGPLGEIWYAGNGTYKAFYVTPGKQEKIKSFKSNELGKWVLRLKVPANLEEQLIWANNPNLRLG